MKVGDVIRVLSLASFGLSYHSSACERANGILEYAGPGAWIASSLAPVVLDSFNKYRGEDVSGFDIGMGVFETVASATSFLTHLSCNETFANGPALAFAATKAVIWTVKHFRSPNREFVKLRKALGPNTNPKRISLDSLMKSRKIKRIHMKDLFSDDSKRFLSTDTRSEVRGEIGKLLMNMAIRGSISQEKFNKFCDKLLVAIPDRAESSSDTKNSDTIQEYVIPDNGMSESNEFSKEYMPKNPLAGDAKKFLKDADSHFLLNDTLQKRLSAKL